MKKQTRWFLWLGIMVGALILVLLLHREWGGLLPADDPAKPVASLLSRAASWQQPVSNFFGSLLKLAGSP